MKAIEPIEFKRAARILQKADWDYEYNMERVDESVMSKVLYDLDLKIRRMKQYELAPILQEYVVDHYTHFVEFSKDNDAPLPERIAQFCADYIGWRFAEFNYESITFKIY